MAFYTIDFDVTAAGVSPDTPQFAGYTGDHRAAVVRFSVPFEGYRYRLELTDGSGVYDVTGLLEADGGTVSCYIPSAWTTAGVAALRLVAIEQEEDGTETVRFHSAPAYLRFEDREDGEPLGQHARPAWQETLDDAQFFLKTVEQKLKNGELKGDKGDKGDKGEKGADGTVAFDDLTDAQKAALKGEKGDTGDRGPQGEKGDIGEKGEKGDMGERGPKGEQGIQGEKGDTGEKGERGEKGDAGEVSLDYAHNTFANALKGTASGSVIVVDDVSPVEHDVAVQVSGDAITDFSTVTVTRYGKNLFDINTMLTANSTQTDNTTFSTNNSVACVANFPAIVGQVYCVSCVGSDSKYVATGNLALAVTDGKDKNYGNGKVLGTSTGTTVEEKAHTVSFTAESEWVSINSLYGTIHDLQIEVGNIPTSYEPYSAVEALPNADGTLTVPSLSPSMTLIAGHDAITMRCEYQRDLNAVIAKLEGSM